MSNCPDTLVPVRPARLATIRVAAMIAAVIIAAAAQARAQAPTATPPRLAQEVIVTATLTPVPLESLSRSVGVVTREDMERWGVTSVIEALRLVPGVDARARGPRDVQTDFSIRGATFGQNLVLVDGLRINDTQSGHHNGEIPLPAVAIDRIEVLTGGGSASHGADALGGTINVISRRGRHSSASLTAGEHGFVDAQTSLSIDPLPDSFLVTAWASRSKGFMFDRDFALGGVAVRGEAAPGWVIDVRHQRRAFGANGFYGASPSKEWTDQTLASVGWNASQGAWTTRTQALYRNHGDHFRWDIKRPGFAENRHRTDAAEVSFQTSRAFGGGSSVTLGGLGGGDWIESSNLGHHQYARGGVFAEWQQTLGSRAALQTGLRFDSYSNFGQSSSPSIGAVTSLTPHVRVRASAARAFRIPTFTELYYSDPNSLGRPDLRAERGWTVDGGVDIEPNAAWNGSVSVFRRWDDDVIDWVRPSTAERFRATNVRDVTATGVEASLSRRWSSAMLRLYYAGLKVDAPAVALFSRYLLEYARHQGGGSVSLPLAAGARVAVNLDHRQRVDGQSYDLVSVRVSRGWKRASVFIDATNLLDETYHEVAGVAMPGRWVTAGLTLR